jgi:small membrane protein
MFIYFIKFLSFFLGFTVITKTYYDYKKGAETIVMLLFWTVTWLFIICAAIFPDKIYSTMQRLSKENIGIGTFVGIAFILLFFITYRIYIKANRLERKLHDLVIKLGLSNIEKEK